jgi:hypothetical protein
MARDAISRQYDVERNSILYSCAEGKEGYRPGLISFQPKQSRSLDLNKIRESIAATRLSGGTAMSVQYFEITALGAVEIRDKEPLLTVSGTEQKFKLIESPSAKGQLQKLRDALGRGEKVTSVTGQVQGWSGQFPVVLRALADAPAVQTLLLIEFEIAKK